MAAVSDSALLPFVDGNFDPIDYLNHNLPSLSLSNQPHVHRQSRSVPLSDLSAQTQSLLSQLNAQNARLSNTLTQLTDEILRSGSRLAYEVELLRGEAIGLTESLTDGLQDDVKKFAPSLSKRMRRESEGGQTVLDSRRLSSPRQEISAESHADEDMVLDPPFLTKLRMLTQVRSRLDDVINAFGDAMEWPLPPSEVSITSSFISVSDPESTSDSQNREEKGREVAKKLRDEITDLLDNGGGAVGIDAAEKRVEALKSLAALWKGTAEEKARIKFVDSLAKLAEEKRKQLGYLTGDQRQRLSAEKSPRRTPSKNGRPSMEPGREERGSGSGSVDGSSGFMRNLQRLRDEIYLE